MTDATTPTRSGSYGDELPPGALLCGGQYTIERYLNSGGFGVTYMAHDSLGRTVVIKECFPSAMCCRQGQTVRLRSATSDTEFTAILELFEKEARALAALQHPYIVGVHQYFRDNGTAYMAMDFVDGKTLLDVIENDPARLGPDEVKELLQQILQALSYIHSHDILHRDISPDNILIDADNLPVLIDFGAAREGATRVSRVLSKVLTVKDGYSPQEFYLAGSDHAQSSDLYALAATFYHVVSRKAPPSSHSRLAATAREKSDPLTPLHQVEGYDPYFLDAINRCLSVFPKDRLQSAAAWRDMIDHERRQKLLMRQAEEDQEIERMVADLVREFEREIAERERRAAEVRARAEQMSAEERARMEAEEAARREAEARARAEAAEAAQREAEEVQAAIAAERAAQAARQAAIEAEEARRFHEALKRPDPDEDAEADDTTPGAPSGMRGATPPAADGAAAAVAVLDVPAPAIAGAHTASGDALTPVAPRRVKATDAAERPAPERPASERPPVRRALFGGRLALSVGGKGGKT